MASVEHFFSVSLIFWEYPIEYRTCSIHFHHLISWSESIHTGQSWPHFVSRIENFSIRKLLDTGRDSLRFSSRSYEPWEMDSIHTREKGLHFLSMDWRAIENFLWSSSLCLILHLPCIQTSWASDSIHFFFRWRCDIHSSGPDFRSSTFSRIREMIRFLRLSDDILHLHWSTVSISILSFFQKIPHFRMSDSSHDSWIRRIFFHFRFLTIFFRFLKRHLIRMHWFSEICRVVSCFSEKEIGHFFDLIEEIFHTLPSGSSEMRHFSVLSHGRDMRIVQNFLENFQRSEVSWHLILKMYGYGNGRSILWNKIFLIPDDFRYNTVLCHLSSVGRATHS